LHVIYRVVSEPCARLACPLHPLTHPLARSPSQAHLRPRVQSFICYEHRGSTLASTCTGTHARTYSSRYKVRPSPLLHGLGRRLAKPMLGATSCSPSFVSTPTGLPLCHLHRGIPALAAPLRHSIACKIRLSCALRLLTPPVSAPAAAAALLLRCVRSGV
jgi:hypothetical protein